MSITCLLGLNIGMCIKFQCLISYIDPNAIRDSFISTFALQVYGTPLDIARCAQQVVDNLTTESVFAWDDFLMNTKLEKKSNNRLLRSESSPSRGLATAPLSNAALVDILTNLEFRTVVHIASDNPGGASQVNQTLHWPNTLISPSGCHVEMNPTFECLKLTITYWMVMALSDIIITPGNDRIPNSGFSRYAAIYGLKGNSLRDPKQCNNILSRHDLGNMQHGNWNCY